MPAPNQFSSIENAILFLQQVFMGEFRSMTFFFAHRNKNQRSWFAGVTNLQGLYLRLVDGTENTILFDGNIIIPMPVYTAKKQLGWDKVEILSKQKQRNVNSKWSYVFQDVREINLYSYGFEIRTGLNLDLVAVQNKHLHLDSTESLFTGNILIRYLDGVDMEVVKFWRFEEDGFDDFIKNKLKHIDKSNSDTPQLGQNRRRLVLE